MKFCYIDESGTGDEPFAVMVGVIADSYRMRLTKEHWSKLINDIEKIIGKEIAEIHTRDFYAGNGAFRGMEGNQRKEIIELIFNWLQERKHPIVFVGVDKEKFHNEFKEDKRAVDISTLWRFMATHLALSMQKEYQKQKKNKGNFLMIFDNEEREEKRFTDLLLNSPDWTDSYYNRNEKKQEKFNQLIDVPHFVDSRDVGLIQLADFICYFLRRHMELCQGSQNEKYDGEAEIIANWFELINKSSLSKSATYPKKGRCECTELFYQYAPECIK